MFKIFERECVSIVFRVDNMKYTVPYWNWTIVQRYIQIYNTLNSFNQFIIYDSLKFQNYEINPRNRGYSLFFLTLYFANFYFFLFISSLLSFYVLSCFLVSLSIITFCTREIVVLTRIFLFLFQITKLFELYRMSDERANIQTYGTRSTSWINEIKRGHKRW